MDSIAKIDGSETIVKEPHGSRSKIQESKSLENLNPNLPRASPGPKPTSSPMVKSAKYQKLAMKNPNPVVYVQRNKIRERKFIVAKKYSKNDTEVSAITCKCHEKTAGDVASKCVCVAYENLRASQEDFFKKRSTVEETDELNPTKILEEAGSKYEVEEDIDRMIRDHDEKEEKDMCLETNESDNGEEPGDRKPQLGSSTAKRRRNKLMEDARRSVPEPGSGRVLHLVKAFEKLLSIPSSKDSENQDNKDEPEENNKVTKWALPGLQPPMVSETQVSSSPRCPSELLLTSENLGLVSRFSISSWDGSNGSRHSDGGKRSSYESSGTVGGRRWKKKQLKATCQKPFQLRTEQRGRQKEEEFVKKIQEMMAEEERQRVPVAQGLPWTTDEPECLIKPPVKENTRPLDLVLHSDVRAAERAEFDHQVSEKISLIEQYKMEMERQQKMLEEEEIRRLRKELAPKAQPMPYFDRPFIPKRSMKHPTIPKEPKFHIPQHKKVKSCMSWTDISSFAYSQV